MMRSILLSVCTALLIISTSAQICPNKCVSRREANKSCRGKDRCEVERCSKGKFACNEKPRILTCTIPLGDGTGTTSAVAVEDDGDIFLAYSAGSLSRTIAKCVRQAENSQEVLEEYATTQRASKETCSITTSCTIKGNTCKCKEPETFCLSLSFIAFTTGFVNPRNAKCIP